MSDRLINLLIVDHDPIFRLGLSTILSNYQQFCLVAVCGTPEDALERLTNQKVDIIIIDPNFDDNSYPGWELCQEIKQSDLSLKICLLTGITDGFYLEKLRDLGIEGYCLKGIPIEQLIEILIQIDQGEIIWPNLTNINQSTIIETIPFSSPLTWLNSWQKLGINQIDKNLDEVNEKLNLPVNSRLDKVFWQGRKRELLAARWLVNQLVQMPIIITTNSSAEFRENQLLKGEKFDSSFGNSLNKSVVIKNKNIAVIFNKIIKKVQTNLINSTSRPLEIDILKTQQKQEILTLILGQTIRVLDDLRFVELTPKQSDKNTVAILQRIWRESALIFLGKYCVVRQNIGLEEIEDLITNYTILVEQEILEKIPFMVDLLRYLLFEEGIIVENLLYRPQAAEARQQAEKILDNLIIQVANGIVSLILNNFSDIEKIKQELYNINMASSREIARFRNSLAWEYRRQKIWEEPQNIFQSQYRLFILGEKGLESILIYAPRQEELEQLTGLGWFVTILLETRDALSPLMRSLIRLIGKGLVYVLTQVIGKGLGLIGRGIMQGVGNSLPETRYSKKKQKETQKNKLN
ncbi:DUF3685 domain-containing protein [Aphanothece sacrum]|uniref:Two-component response regulator n=1 Tax=Aphanothece sacrum FPU1 TaxID=1920663 RepID=A0A401IHF7_APHSA|nr:DUF3685 domain-containing protein [Aphanothece sacrum]GBF80581.1 two-component response regulator [Aphanothece sacrum FPU1]GBF84029.1 two-component response regulator [Aphanothece sacrum FPU3]